MVSLRMGDTGIRPLVTTDTKNTPDGVSSVTEVRDIIVENILQFPSEVIMISSQQVGSDLALQAQTRASTRRIKPSCWIR